jgi:hypothetical protein
MRIICFFCLSVFFVQACAEGILPDWMKRSKTSSDRQTQSVVNNKSREMEEKLELERKEIAEERKKLSEEKMIRESSKKPKKIQLKVSKTEPDESGEFSISIDTGTDTSSLKINDEELGGKQDGKYYIKKIARIGQESSFNIIAKDINSNVDTATFTVYRKFVNSNLNQINLDITKVKAKKANDSVAIIIGIEKYKRVSRAEFSNADAQVFYDYSIRALGVKPENIKLLIDEAADDVDILSAFKNWLPLKVKKNTTDIYVFYSGHGLPSEDGKSLYFLPYGTEKNFIERTAINQQEIITALQNSHPRSVTMFIDSCYSGQTRGGETLIASARPIAVKVSASSYPSNFTVISASAPDQLSSSSPDLKHGIFSFYLMKGMEGDADLNIDGKITAGEMQEYLIDHVGRHAMVLNRVQNPQLFGDSNRILLYK